jgi:hypothetical protein
MKYKASIMNKVFYWCVEALEFWAAQIGMTYEEINVWLFVIIMPALLIIQSVIILILARKVLKMKRR